MYKYIRASLPILEKDETMYTLLKSRRFINSKRQSPNLKSILTKAKFDTRGNESPSPTVVKCKRGNCGTCKHMIEGPSITFNRQGEFHVKSDFNCAAKNCIYVIICAGCKEQYIGQTECLRSRVRVHKQQINHPETRCIPLSGHLDMCAAGKDIKFYIYPFYKMSNNDRQKRIKIHLGIRVHFVSVY